MKFFTKKKDRISYEKYIKSLLAVRTEYFNAVEQGEYLYHVAIIYEYRKQNKYKLLRSLDEKYRPFIKYGKISSFTGKILLSFTFLYILFFIYMIVSRITDMRIPYDDLISIFFIFVLFSNLWVHFHFRKKYEIAEKFYNKEKKKPNWRRKQILQRLTE